MVSKKRRNILEQVQELQYEFECGTGKKPTSLYFGAVEYMEACSYIRIQSDGKTTLGQYFGLPFFVVNHKHHLAVGWEDRDG